MNNKNITISFVLYSILLIIYSVILLQLVVYSPVLILLGAIPKGFTYSILTIIKILALPFLFELFAIYIWIKIFVNLNTKTVDITKEFKINVILMYLSTFILSLFLIYVCISFYKTKMEHNRYLAETQEYMLELKQQEIENNKNAAKNCKMVEGLCITRERISYQRGDTFKDTLINANNVCSELGMRVPTKEEYDIALKPLMDFKYKLEHNSSDEEFVKMREYYSNTLSAYHRQFWNDNFLTSSTKDGKAITYKVGLKRYYNDDGCRNVRTRNVYGQICISASVEIPVVEYHDFSEPKDSRKYIEYSLHCVK